MSNYLAVLGNTPQLSLAELQAVCDQPVIYDGGQVAEIELADDQAAVKLMEVLGGTSKILRIIETVETLKTQEAFAKVVSILSQMALENNSNIDFFVAEIGRDHLEQIRVEEIKKELKKSGIRSRYVEGSRNGLNSASLANNSSLKEVVVAQSEHKVVIGLTVSYQDINDWALRDRQKPFAEHKRGLLPPKVARMMVNLALQKSETTETLLDPFCGAGTIAFEAMLRGQNVIAADVDQVATEGTQRNLDWFAENYPQTQKYTAQVQTADATKIELEADSIAYLVTEPFLGRSKPRPEQLPNIFKGLEKLYLGSFKNWRKFLKNEATIIIVFPVVELESSDKIRRYTLENFIDKLANLGYTTNSEPIMYAKPGAQVKRAIYQLKYIKS